VVGGEVKVKGGGEERRRGRFSPFSFTINLFLGVYLRKNPPKNGLVNW
tara:strand:- start:26 stop:169 length:144 start_codon:yes stop_codon:yes gene_type:complete